MLGVLAASMAVSNVMACDRKPEYAGPVSCLGLLVTVAP